MEDNFKNALKKAREQLEQDKPSGEVWEKLKSKLEADQQPVKLSIASRHKYKFAAAAGLILIVLCYIFYKNDLKSIPEPVIAEQDANTNNSSDIYNRYKESVLVYRNQVAEQEKKIEVLLKDEPALRIELDSGVNELRELFSDLEKKLDGEIGKEQILQMMVSNLRLQEKVINNQLALLQHLKKEKDEEL